MSANIRDDVDARPHKCGCVEQLMYEEPAYETSGGWRSYWTPKFKSRCDAHAFEDKTKQAFRDAATQTFYSHFQMTEDEARLKIALLREEKEKIESEIARLIQGLDQLRKLQQ